MSPKDPWLDDPKESRRGSIKEELDACCWCDEEEEEVPIPDKRLVVLLGFLLHLSRCGGTTEQV